MSDDIRRALIAEANQLEVSDRTWEQVKARSMAERPRRGNGRRRVKGRWLTYGSSAAALVIIGIGVSGFVSPVMAATLHKIPVIGALYSFNIPQMNQYATKTDPSVTDHGITISVPKAYYDGTNLAVIYKIQVPESYQRLSGKGTQIPSLQSTKVTLNGKPLAFQSEQWSDKLTSKGTYSGNIYWNLSSRSMPKSGRLIIPIEQIGTVKGHWTLSIPVSDIAIQKATNTVSAKQTSSTYDGMTLTVKKVTKGPVWTNFSMELSQPLQANGEPKYEMGFNGWSFFVTPRGAEHGGIGYLTSQQIPRVVGNKEIWDVSIQWRTPASGVKYATVKPSFLKLSPSALKQAIHNSQAVPWTNLPQLNVTVPIQ